MKRKLLSSILFSLIGGFGFSQGVPFEKGYRVDKSDLIRLQKEIYGISSVERELINQQYFIHYPILDNLKQGADSTFESFLWRLNKDYSSTDPQKNFNFNLAAVVFKNWNGFTDFGYYDDISNSYDETPVKPNRYVRVDTVYAIVSHENNSGTENKVIVELSSQSGTGVFSESAAVLFRDTTKTTTSLSKGGNWVGTGALTFLEIPVNKDVPVGKFPGIRLRYEGSKADTMAFLGSYVPNPESTADVPLASSYPYSYLRQPGTLLNNGVPSIFSPAGVWYVEADGKTPQKDPSSGDTVFYYLQNIQIFMKATIKESTANVADFAENNLKIGMIHPNPAVDNASLNIQLAKSANVTVQIFDISGKLISNQPQGFRATGEHRLVISTSDLSSGSYIYNLVVDGLPAISRKLSIIK